MSPRRGWGHDHKLLLTVFSSQPASLPKAQQMTATSLTRRDSATGEPSHRRRLPGPSQRPSCGPGHHPPPLRSLSPAAQPAALLRRGRTPLLRPYLDGIPVTDEDLLLVDVEIHRGDDGEVGRGPLVKVDDELEGEVGQLLADGGEDKGAVGGEAEEGPVEGAEDAAACREAEGAPGAEAAPDAVAQGALLV